MITNPENKIIQSRSLEFARGLSRCFAIGLSFSLFARLSISKLIWSQKKISGPILSLNYHGNTEVRCREFMSRMCSDDMGIWSVCSVIVDKINVTWTRDLVSIYHGCQMPFVGKSASTQQDYRTYPLLKNPLRTWHNQHCVDNQRLGAVR